MKPAISTNISQSKRLLSCGVDPKTADMVWLKAEPPFLSLNRGCNRAIPEVGDVPAWSLSALCSLIPSKVTAPHANTPCYFRLYHMPHKWRAMYHDGKESGDAEDYYWQCASEQDGTDLIEACVKTIEWLTEHNYPLNKIEE